MESQNDKKKARLPLEKLEERIAPSITLENPAGNTPQSESREQRAGDRGGEPGRSAPGPESVDVSCGSSRPDDRLRDHPNLLCHTAS